VAVTECDCPHVVKPEKEKVEATISIKFEIAFPIMLALRVLEPVVSCFPQDQLLAFHLPAQCFSQCVLADAQYGVVSPHDTPPSQLQQPLDAGACGCNVVDVVDVDGTGPRVGSCFKSSPGAGLLGARNSGCQTKMMATIMHITASVTARCTRGSRRSRGVPACRPLKGSQSFRMRGMKKPMAAPRTPVKSAPKTNDQKKSNNTRLLENIVAGSVVVVSVVVVIVFVVVSVEVGLVVCCVGKGGVILKLLIVALPALLPEHTSEPHGGESNHAMVFASLPQ